MQATSKGLEKVVQGLTASENDGEVSGNFCKVIPGHQLYKFSSVQMGSSKYAVMTALLLKTQDYLFISFALFLLFNIFNLIKLGIFLIDTIGLKCDSTLESEECCM